MKFKRNIAMYLKENEIVTVPKNEFWRYTIFDAFGNSEGQLGSASNVQSSCANACSGGMLD